MPAMSEFKHDVVEMYRAVIPANKVINDNHGQHYRTIQGNQEWLGEQIQALMQGFWMVPKGRGANRHVEKMHYPPPSGFSFPEVESVKRWFEGKINQKTGEPEPVVLRHEVWKLGNRRFDPHNYAHTFKTPLDVLVHKGFVPDDSWKYILRTEFSGGGYAVWGRAMRYENDGLPDGFTLDWWRSIGAENNDILARTLVYRE